MGVKFKSWLKMANIRPVAPFAALAMVAAVGGLVFEDELMERPEIERASREGVTQRLNHISKAPVVTFRHAGDCAQKGLSEDFCFAAMLSYSATTRSFDLFGPGYVFNGDYRTRTLLSLSSTHDTAQAAVAACEAEHGPRNCQERSFGARAEAVFVMRQGETNPARIEIVWPDRNGSYRGRDGNSYNLKL